MLQLPGIVPLYSAAEMRTVDRLAVDEIGLPAAVLMERAGLGAAGDILEWFADAQRIAILCGAGNNGGDGFVLARHLAATGRSVDVLLVEAESKIRREAKMFLEVARKIGVNVERVNITKWSSRLPEYDLLVDAMLGTGASAAPRPDFEAVIRAANATLKPIVALDIPTGVDASTGVVETVAIQADLTLTFHAPKIGLAVAPGRFHAGRVKAIDIGIPVQADGEIQQALATPALLSVVPPKPRWASKHDVGRVVCVGGSVGMAGAISLTSQAALRGGAGVVWGVVPEPLAMQLDVAVPEVQFRGAIADQQGLLTVGAAQGLEPLVERSDVVAFGPGIGESEQVSALARWAVRHAPALVLDAQGITAFAGDASAIAARDGSPTLLTPHVAELAALTGQPLELVRSHRIDAARAAAMQTRATILLKGEDTIVCEPNGEFLVCRSHVGMATSGSGDVLTGVCAALMARGLSPTLAACCAALACARASELASEIGGSPNGVIAHDLIDLLPGALSLESSAYPGGAQ